MQKIEGFTKGPLRVSERVVAGPQYGYRNLIRDKMKNVVALVCDEDAELFAAAPNLYKRVQQLEAGLKALVKEVKPILWGYRNHMDKETKVWWSEDREQQLDRADHALTAATSLLEEEEE